MRRALGGRRSAFLAGLLAVTALATVTEPAEAVITPPVVVDGPAAEILEFGGAAMAADGSGGLAYVKVVAGVPHVFVCRYVGGAWQPPIRVDWESTLPASQARIAASPDGQLLVVWVSPVATVHGKAQYALFSARIGRGAASFGPQLLVDSNVGEGVGVAPAIAAASAGKAIVAYRVITFDFSGNKASNFVQLRPGDVMADVRVARLNGDRWSRLGAINRNPEASMRPPAAGNGPQVGVGLEGGAVVAWQEPDQTGAARIWMRRIFGTTPGPVLQVSPSVWEGRQVTADAEALSLTVTPYVAAQAAFSVAPAAGSVLAGDLLVNSLPATYSTTAGILAGPKVAGAGPVGPADIAAAESPNKKLLSRLGFVSGGGLRQMAVEASGATAPFAGVAGPAALPGSEPAIAVNPEGGSVVAYPALDSSGSPAVAVLQEFRSGGAQVATVSSAAGGPVADLSVGRSGAGDGLIGFRQGEAGAYAIVAERVSAPPSRFKVKVAKRWTKPNAVQLSWQAAASTVGGVRYAVLVNGREVARHLRRRKLHPRAGLLGNGELSVQVLAEDALGSQLLSNRGKLRVDGERPRATVRAGKHHRVVVSVADDLSGLSPGATKVRFGDGESGARESRFEHEYARPGTYTVVVRARDRAGNRLFRKFRTRVR